MMEPTYDVVVVGARVAGSATAMLLGRAGLRVLMLDRQPYGTDTLSTHALMRGGVIQLSRWGLLDAVLDRGTPLVTATSFHYGDQELSIPLRTSAEVPGLIAPRRTVLDPVLVAAARDAGVDVRHGIAVRDVLHDSTGRVCGVVVRDPQGEERSVKAGIVIGADGTGSSIARLVSAPMLRRGEASASNIYGYLPGWGDAAFHWHYRAADAGRGPVAAGVIPTNDHRSCVFVSQPTADFDSTSRHDVGAAYLAALEAIDLDLAAQARTAAPLSLSVFRGRPGHLREPAGPGWLLVGDAGFFRDPLTAHGITDALRDAEAAAAAVLGGSLADFRRYQAERDPLANRLLDVTERIVSFGWDYATLEALHKQLNAVMKEEVAILAARGTANVPIIRRPPESPHIVLVSPPST